MPAFCESLGVSSPLRTK